MAAYALVARAEFPAGAGFAVPTQIVLVPMLLLLPTPSVPLLVALALLITTSIDASRGAVSRDRVVLSIADAWFAIAPALVLVLGGRADAGLERLAVVRRGARRPARAREPRVHRPGLDLPRRAPARGPLASC